RPRTRFPGRRRRRRSTLQRLRRRRAARPRGTPSTRGRRAPRARAGTAVRGWRPSRTDATTRYRRRMADVRGFRAERYSLPLDDLVAPPYDVISEEQRREYLARSPYNVVHLTLPDSEQQAAADLAGWRETGVLARESSDTAW